MHRRHRLHPVPYLIYMCGVHPVPCRHRMHRRRPVAYMRRPHRPPDRPTVPARRGVNSLNRKKKIKILNLKSYDDIGAIKLMNIRALSKFFGNREGIIVNFILKLLIQKMILYVGVLRRLIQLVPKVSLKLLLLNITLMKQKMMLKKDWLELLLQRISNQN